MKKWKTEQIWAGKRRAREKRFIFFHVLFAPFLLISLLQFSKLFITYKATTNAHINAQNWKLAEGGGKGANNAAADSSFIIYKFQMCWRRVCVLLLSEFEFDCIENGEDGWMLLSWHWRAPIASNFDKSAHTQSRISSIQYETEFNNNKNGLYY